MKINEAAKLTGLTVRTLHYYDQIGLLSPGKTPGAGYRDYSDADLAVLQQILFYRELDFPLGEIKDIMANPAYSREDALKKQRVLLTQKRDRLDRLIGLLDRTAEGGTTMSFKEFDSSEIEETKKAYAREAKERWGDTPAYAQYEARTKGYEDAQWQLLGRQGDALLKEIAACRQEDPAGAQARDLVKQWQDYITRNYYTCTDEILAGLGQMYVADGRFTQNMDRFGQGTAEFLSRAIAHYCAK